MSISVFLYIYLSCPSVSLSVYLSLYISLSIVWGDRHSKPHHRRPLPPKVCTLQLLLQRRGEEGAWRARMQTNAKNVEPAWVPHSSHSFAFLLLLFWQICLVRSHWHVPCCIVNVCINQTLNQISWQLDALTSLGTR